jgi:hypothetical protein
MRSQILKVAILVQVYEISNIKRAQFRFRCTRPRILMVVILVQVYVISTVKDNNSGSGVGDIKFY